MVLSFLKPYILMILLVVGVFFSGFFSGAYTATIQHKCPTPKPCPPQTVFQIHNEKLKTKGNSSLDITNLLKDNTAIQVLTDSLQTIAKDTNTYKKKRRFFGRLFGKK